MYTRQESNLVCDMLFERGLTKASVKRMFGMASALVNFVTRELDLKDKSSLSGIYLGELNDLGERERQPMPLASIRSIIENPMSINCAGAVSNKRCAMPTKVTS